MSLESRLILPDHHPYWLRDLLCLGVCLGIFFFLWLGGHPLMVPDEARYSEVAREMLATGNYITPHLNGVVFLDKPILYYWLQSFSIRLFGLHEWSLRFWSALLGMAGCLFMYTTGRILFDRRTGIIAALLLASCPLYFFLAHYANLDLEVAVLISATLLAFIAAWQYPVGKLRTLCLISAYVLAGFAVLTKGMIGIVFPALIIGVWIVLLNRWRIFLEMHLLTGITIILMIALPWFILVQKANPDFFRYFFIDQQIFRFLSNNFNDQARFWFYLPIVIAGMLTWIIFLPQAITQKCKLVIYDRRQRPIELYLLLWPLLIFIFFSIPTSKTIGYILPVLPPLALLIANYLSKTWENINRQGIFHSFIGYSVLAFSMAIALLIAPHITMLAVPEKLIPYLYGIAGLFFISSGLMLVIVRRSKNLIKPFLIIWVTLVLAELIFIYAAPYADFPSTKPLALTIKRYLQPGDTVATYYIYYHDLPVYTGQRITIVSPNWNDLDVVSGDNWRHQLSDGMRSQAARQWLIDDKNFRRQWWSDKRIFVLVDEKYLTQFKAKAKDRFYKLNEYQEVVLVTNKF